MPITQQDSIVITQLHQALLAAMSRQPYAKITVRDLAAGAGVSRQTFYQYFPNRDALLTDYVDSMFEVFYQNIEEPLRGDIHPGMGISNHLFAQWSRNRDFARLMFQPGLEALLIRRFRSYITRVMGFYIREHGIPVTDPERLAYMTDYLAGASWMVLQRWVESNFTYPESDLAGLFTQLTQPGFLDALIRPVVPSV